MSVMALFISASAKGALPPPTTPYACSMPSSRRSAHKAADTLTLSPEVGTLTANQPDGRSWVSDSRFADLAFIVLQDLSVAAGVDERNGDEGRRDELHRGGERVGDRH